MIFKSVDLAGLPEVANVCVEKLRDVPVWLFYGEIGAGKTTFIKNICRAMDVSDVMSSPTFSIVNEYASTRYNKVYHFDFYRVRNEQEAIDIGADEYFYSGYPCLIEWPEKIPSLIPPEHVSVSITIENNTQRTIAISVHDGKEENRI